jgi:hypothetical protein
MRRLGRRVRLHLAVLFVVVVLTGGLLGAIPGGQSAAGEISGGLEDALPPGVSLSSGTTYVAYLGLTLAVAEALTNVSGNVSTVWLFEESGGGSPWMSWSAGLPAEIQGLSELKFGRAYFIVSTAAAEWHFAAVEPPVFPAPQALVPGVNSLVYLGPSQAAGQAFESPLPVGRIWRAGRDAGGSLQWELWDPLLPAALRGFDRVEFGRPYFIVANGSAPWPFGPMPTGLFGGVDATEVRLLGNEVGLGDEFGWSGAVSGNTMVIGAPFDDELGTDSGAAYVFELIDDRWTQTARLLADDGSRADWFARWVRIDGDLIAVGSPFFDPLQDNRGSGAVYLFERGADGWSQVAQVLPDDPRPGIAFGYLLDIQGDVLAVGAPGDGVAVGDVTPLGGAVYMFRRDGDQWVAEAKLQAPEPQQGDDFGGDVALEGNAVVIGAPGTSIGTVFQAGAAYVYERNAIDWAFSARLQSPDIAQLGSFGAAADIDAGVIAIGSVAEGGLTDIGTVNIYERGAATWLLGGSTRDAQQTLVGHDTVAGDWFGFSVELRGDLLAVGAPRRDHDTLGLVATGGAYLFQRGAEAWEQVAQLLPDDSAEAGVDANFGWRMYMNDHYVVVGAWLADTETHGENSGAAYAYRLP